MNEFKLPPHITIDKEGYYYSKNTDRYISQKNIKNICESYWKNEEKEVVAKTVTVEQIINKPNRQKRKVKPEGVFIYPDLNEVEQLPVKEVSKYPPHIFEPTNWENK